jgi:hypothetical protein
MQMIIFFIKIIKLNQEKMQNIIFTKIATQILMSENKVKSDHKMLKIG